MRTVEDEKKLVETFDQTTASIKNDSRPVFAELLKATEDYQKSIAQTAFLGTKLADLMRKVVAISPDPEMNPGLEDIAEIFTTHEKQNEDFSRVLLSSMLVSMRQQQDNEKRNLPEYIKSAKAQRRASQKAVQNAEVATKKIGKKGGDLQSKISELNQLMQTAQQNLSEQLKIVLQFQRGPFCLYAKCWSEAFSLLSEQHGTIDKKISESTERVKALGSSAETISASQIELVAERKRTFINLAGLSAEWKKIFKDAGISPKDFQNEDTAKLILQTLERAGVNTTSLTSESFAAIGETAPATDDSSSPQSALSPLADDDNPPTASRRGPPLPSRRGMPPPPPTRGHMPPRGAPPPPPSRSTTSGNLSPSTPVAPAAPPQPLDVTPVPLPRNATAPPPTPTRKAMSHSNNVLPSEPTPASSSGGGGGNLLAQIQEGKKLKPASERPQQDASNMPSASDFNGADLSSMLMSALSTRRVAMKEGPKEDEEEDWGEDVWSD